MSTPDQTASWRDPETPLDDRRTEVAELLADAVAERDRLKSEQAVLCAQIDHAVARVQMYRAVDEALDRAMARKRSKP